MEDLKILCRLGKIYAILFCLMFGTAASFIGPTTAQPSLAQACPDSVPGDEDGDDIPDTWEKSGVDLNGDGNLEWNSTRAGADPKQKDLFLEIDYMEGHQPFADVIPRVVEAFRTEASG